MQGCVAIFETITKTTDKPRNSKFSKELRTLGDHIRHERLVRNLLQKEVAEFIGVTKESIFNWESNKMNPRVHCLPAIMNFLGYCPIHYPKSFGERLRLHRTHKGLTQTDLAKILGVDPSTITNWEAGGRVDRIVHQQKLREFMAGSGLKIIDTINSKTRVTRI